MNQTNGTNTESYRVVTRLTTIVSIMKKEVSWEKPKLTGSYTAICGEWEQFPTGGEWEQCRHRTTTIPFKEIINRCKDLARLFHHPQALHVTVNDITNNSLLIKIPTFWWWISCFEFILIICKTKKWFTYVSCLQQLEQTSVLTVM